MKYEDVDDTGSRLPVGRNAPGEHHRPRGPDTPSKKESIEIKFVTGSVDSGRDVGPAADGAASGTRARNFTFGAQRGALSTSFTSGLCLEDEQIPFSYDYY